MRIKIVATMAIAGVLAAVAPAGASLPDGASEVDTSVDADVMWAEARVPDEDARRVAIRIRAPRARRKGRMLWHRCRFATSDPATYRCGIDVSRGSLARKRASATSRKWVAVVLVDGRRVAHTRFRP